MFLFSFKTEIDENVMRTPVLYNSLKWTKCSNLFTVKFFKKKVKVRENVENRASPSPL